MSTFNRGLIKTLPLKAFGKGYRVNNLLSLHAGSSIVGNIQHYSSSRKSESSLFIAGLGVLGATVTLQYGLKLYNAAIESNAANASDKNESDNTTKSDSTQSHRESTKSKKSEKVNPEKAAESIWTAWFASGYYEGGFEDKMSRREAALILGVRESATLDRIKDAHRKILVLNHPDRGGSAYLSAKVNEAKDLLMKGK